jgi:hypothetical protein
MFDVDVNLLIVSMLQGNAYEQEEQQIIRKHYPQYFVRCGCSVACL